MRRPRWWLRTAWRGRASSPRYRPDTAQAGSTIRWTDARRRADGSRGSTRIRRATRSKALFAPRLTTARGLPTSRRDGHRVRRGAPRGARASGTRVSSIVSSHHSGTQGMSVIAGSLKRGPTAIRSVSWSDACERASTSGAAADQRGCERVRSVGSTVAAVRHYSRTVSSHLP